MTLLFYMQLLATFFMTGLIWFIQVVHYPLLGEVSQYREAAYDTTRMRLTTWVMAPPMLIEFITAGYLVWKPIPDLPSELAWAGLGLLLAIWISTAFVQAPKHQVLAKGHDIQVHLELVRSNWIRTIFWTVRCGLLIYCLSLFEEFSLTF